MNADTTTSADQAPAAAAPTPAASAAPLPANLRVFSSVKVDDQASPHHDRAGHVVSFDVEAASCLVSLDADETRAAEDVTLRAGQVEVL